MKGKNKKIVISFSQYLEDKSYDYTIYIEPRRFTHDDKFSYSKAGIVCKNIFMGLGGGLKYADDGNNYYIVLPDSLKADKLYPWINDLPYGKYRIYTLTTKEESRKAIQHNTFNSVEYTQYYQVMDSLKLYIPAFDASLHGYYNLLKAIEFEGLRDIDSYYYFKKAK